MHIEPQIFDLCLWLHMQSADAVNEADAGQSPDGALVLKPKPGCWL